MQHTRAVLPLALLLAATLLGCGVASADEPSAGGSTATTPSATPPSTATPSATASPVVFTELHGIGHCYAVAEKRSTVTAYLVRDLAELDGLSRDKLSSSKSTIPCDPSGFAGIPLETSPILAIALNGCGGSDNLALRVEGDTVHIERLASGKWTCKRGGTVQFWYLVEGLQPGIDYGVVIDPLAY